MEFNFSPAPVRKILDGAGSPDKRLKIIHIAGTNGKGSTAEFFTRILLAAGKRTGTYTSPEVYSFYDQIRIDGEPISPEIYEKYRAQAQSDGASEFEMQTAAAIIAFAGEGCEWAVIECGMGGLNDATNAVAKKELAVITSISLEHTQYLGNSLTEICRQKAGIIKDCPAVINAHQGEEVKSFFKGCLFADKIDKIYDGGFVYGGKEFALNAYGCFQPHNAACAIEGARLLGIDESAIYDGIKKCFPRGRLEKFCIDGATYILDGAHNPDAFRPLQRYLFSQDKKRTVIFGCLSDKDVDGNISKLIADEVIAVPCPSPRTRTIEDVTAHLKKYFKNIRQAESVSSALDRADGDVIVVCGSFTLLKEAKEWIEKRQ